MPQIISNTFEIQKRLGSGGGGIVYLGRHTHLNKPVAIKADKRILTVSPEELNQEVKILTQLHHTYIPQLYDYVYQDGIVYTIIDYIEGESLDKLLERGETVPQPQLIQWAFQLLDALQYLHSIKPHGILHGDIKPANIMVTPEGDIRLIDFNIALALGEKGAVRLGYSEGYASPEHYYSDENESTTRMPNEPSDVQTDPEKTKILKRNQRAVPEGQRKGGVLDARSDIYMLGATLYHLISGVLPPSRAKDVPPLPEGCCDSTVAEIIYKAMAPEPEDRYQTAEEMIRALKDLYKNDPAAKRFKKRFIGITSAIVVLFLLGGLTGFSGLRLQRQAEETARIAAEAAEEQERLAKENEQRANQALEYVTAAREKIDQGAADSAVVDALEALLLHTPYDSAAQYTLTDALGVYQLSTDFQAERLITLPSTPFRAGLSPNGKRAFAMYQWSLAVFDTETGAMEAMLPIEHSALCNAAFLDDSRIIYSGENGLRCYDISSGSELWKGKPATAIALSYDCKRIATIYKDETEAEIYDADTGEALITVSFHGRKQWVPINDNYIDDSGSLLCLNETGTLLAASFEDGSVLIYDTVTGEEKEVVFDPNDYLLFRGGFYQTYFILYARGGSHNPFFAVVDTEDRSRDYSGSLAGSFSISVDQEGVFLVSGNTLIRFHPEDRTQTEAAYSTEKDITGFYCTDKYTVVAAEKSFLFFDNKAAQLSRTETAYNCDYVFLAGETALIGSQDNPSLRILKLNQHQEAQLLRYDTEFVHREARLSADEKTIVLFRRDAYQVYSADGDLIIEGNFPDEEQIFDHQFRREGQDSWLEVYYYDGLILRYSAKDGTLLSKEHGAPYDNSLEEDFFTDRFHVHTRPRQAPEVFDNETGELVGYLEATDDITYITQVEDGFIAEYINTQGERYGLLMNNRLETLARLPMLTDVVNGKLVFDYPTGDLRCCPIYSLNELIAIAQEYP